MSGQPAQRYHWSWNLRSPVASLWPLVSNTDQFNRDCGYPAVKPAPHERGAAGRRVRAATLGLTIEWQEEPFEWIEPVSYRLSRHYTRGPLAHMRVACTLHPAAMGGTRLVYEIDVTPSGLLGRFLLPLWINQRVRPVTARVFRGYDDTGSRPASVGGQPRRSSAARGGAERLTACVQALTSSPFAAPALVRRLAEHVTSVDEGLLGRMRPYAIADEWRADRRETLQLFLAATRVGLLDLRWELLCPHCRGSRQSEPTLQSLRAEAHCDTCNLDFTANFDQSVELTFSPNASIRPTTRREYCVGGPQVTPHVLAQQRVAAGSDCRLQLRLTPGRYRMRSPGVAEQQPFRVGADGSARIAIELGARPTGEPAVAPNAAIVLRNAGALERLALVERLAWSDQSTTAAEVTSLQIFRDMFSNEVLRRGERFAIGSLTVVFTDLKNSTQLYRDIGDAPAFGRVLTHFEILKAAVVAEGGSIVKTMGDAVMAVFTQPLAAIHAVSRAQQELARPSAETGVAPASAHPFRREPLLLKAGLHCGPCLAINQNDRLDYFGTTVNLAARLCGLCSGGEIVLSAAVQEDPSVTVWLGDGGGGMTAEPAAATVRGFGPGSLPILRLRSSECATRG